MIIGMDVDDVVADLISEWLHRYRHRTGDYLYPSHIRDWEISGYATKMSPAEFYGILHEPDLYGSVSPMPDAIDTVRRLREDGHRIVYITACVGNTAGYKKQWLIRHGLLHEFQHQDFIAAHDKSLVSGVEVLVDDRIENVEAFPGKAILIRRPHNEDLMCWRPRARLHEVPSLLEYIR